MELTETNVKNVFDQCLLTQEPIEEAALPQPSGTDHTLVEGILHRFTFDTNVLELHREEISNMLAQLPDQFHSDRGGRWSFINSCDNKQGRQWADHHFTMEKMWSLGIAVGKAQYSMPRDLWPSLHAGMPYMVVTKAA